MTWIDRLARRAAEGCSDHEDGADHLARSLATRVPRRRMLGIAAGGLASAGALWPSRADAAPCPSGRPKFCAGSAADACCLSSDTCCVNTAHEAYCAPAGQICCTDEPCAAANCCHYADGKSCIPDGYTCCPTPSGGFTLCTAGQNCVNGTCTKCASGQTECGSKCCGKDETCCDPNKELCCAVGTPCCPVGQTSGSEGTRTCCGSGDHCVKEVLPGNTGVTPGSPTVCCPPSRLVTATATPVCCPPGSVRHPSGGFSTRGGLCCTSQNVCGKECCDSTPSFPMVCNSGHCQFKIAHVQGHSASAKNGDVPITVKFGGAASGQIEIVAGPLAGISNSAEVAAKTVVLGKTRLRSRGKGSKKIKVPLNPQGRKDLNQHHSLHTHVVITFKDKRKTLRSEKPMTVKAGSHKH